MNGVQPITRASQLTRLRDPTTWDVIVIGGGATGLGTALDAAARGYSVVLLEAKDFAKGTSSRATKLIHGGVRYLAQGNITLVAQALRERARLLANAPHLAQPLGFVIPAYRRWQVPYYGLGLKLYDALAGQRSLGSSEAVSAQQVRSLLPTARREGLCGGVTYWDGQFDDARLAVAIARTAVSLGAVMLNHCAATGLLREGGRIRGVTARDVETGEAFALRARCVVNATGVWVDTIHDMDRDADEERRPPLVRPSQGVHLVVDRRFLPGEHALMVPKTSDGRVLFAIPWLGKIILGTTDTPRDDAAAEPRPTDAEIDFILHEAGRYLSCSPSRADVRSAWAGLRPLVRPMGGGAETRRISRKHDLLVGRSGLVTVTGGKWTTYRSMAEDVIDRCVDEDLLPQRGPSRTCRFRLAGAPCAAASGSITQPPGDHLYGSDAAVLRALPGADRWLWRDGAGGLSEAMVRFAVRHEMARTVEDVLARRSRLLFLDSRSAESASPAVAALVAEELARPIGDVGLPAFQELARRYTIEGAAVAARAAGRVAHELA